MQRTAWRTPGRRLHGMSTFWTPDGERPISGETPPADTPPRQPAGFTEAAAAELPDDAQVDELREQLLAAPAEIIVANHAFGLFELAALHLSATPPNLNE